MPDGGAGARRPAVFVLGFPLRARPFYTHALAGESAASFDLL